MDLCIRINAAVLFVPIAELATAIWSPGTPLPKLETQELMSLTLALLGFAACVLGKSLRVLPVQVCGKVMQMWQRIMLFSAVALNRVVNCTRLF